MQRVLISFDTQVAEESLVYLDLRATQEKRAARARLVCKVSLVWLALEDSRVKLDLQDPEA
jgi:hypothetical protein